jgi:hypothetical protein
MQPSLLSDRFSFLKRASLEKYQGLMWMNEILLDGNVYFENISIQLFAARARCSFCLRKKLKVPNSHRRFPILPNRDPMCILVVVGKGGTLYRICQILHPILGMVRMA